MSNSLIQANIFFFLTSISVVLLTLLIIAVLMYMMLILRDFRGVSHKVKEEADLIAMDIDEARAHLKREGSDMKNTYDYFKHLILGKKAVQHKKKKV